MNSQHETPPTHLGRTPCCSKIGLNRGPWTPDEDLLLTKYIQAFGEGRWRTLPKKAGLQRCGKSCRLRWMNYLRPDVKRGYISPDEEDLILRLHRLLGNRWSLIAGRIPGRTDNEIKNYWNTHLSKQLISQGIDPRTHKPLSQPNLENRNPTNATEGSTEKSDISTVKRSSDLVDLTNTQHSDHHLHVRKRHKAAMNEMEAFMGSATISAPYHNKQSDQIFDWKYHFKAGGLVGDHHMISSTFDVADRQSLNIPYLEALEPGLINHGFSPFFINNPAPATTAFDIQSIQNMCSDHCDQISNNVQLNPPSINKIEFNEYEGNMLQTANFDRRYHLPKAEIFLDANCSAINYHNNGVHQIYVAPSSSNQDCYGPFLESAAHEELLLNNFNPSSSCTTSSSQPLQLRLEPENPNSNACDLWSLYQYHPYT
ncbi:hypothetical protein SUGI_0198060 [Cryptomeria japonica]|uniref:transcription factor MYB117 n=1 Tax=Cryptomeria japonica TaxID=3369 RepID=UPI0024089C6D|nr:transcription factor MYB117 [Cryptomeria japonica]GLJ12803.1 hypothetical protein SUGI_0198060 [Cryptomeria japonica]